MNLTVKTLKGGKFTVEVDPSNTVAQVKDAIERTNSELPAASMKLIHSGKVLKDDDQIDSCNIKPNDFLVVMIAKAKKAPAEAPAAAAPVPSSATTTEASVPATPAPPAAASTPGAPRPSTTAPAATASTPAVAGTTVTSEAVSSPTEFPAEVINNLKALGFPESEVMACLRASNGNPDVAVEFLMNGIPPGIGGGGNATGAAGGGRSAGGGSLDALRNHPQFNDLRRLVQSNPSTLQTVLAQIGQQQPELLQAINANQAEFLQMMNEPVVETSSGGGGTATSSSNAPAAPSGAAANPFSMDPTQLSNLLSSMPPTELAAMAQMMGMSVEQLQQTAQMISAMPQEQVQQYMNLAMAAQGMDMEGLAGMMGGAGGGGGGAQVLRLSEEEMAAVDRLTEMGFDRAEAAQAYLACDKNEALAANLLMDGGFGGFGGDMGDDDVGDGGEGDDDMYD
eukprot:CCRYP_002739-RA/>CCRYP_002739-RA protein AED:0.21 eAED:0.21 QI:119/1/1/1/1/1/3/283/451